MLAAEVEDLLEVLAQAVHEDVGIGDRPGVGGHADAARVAVRQQGDVHGRPDRGAEGIEALEAGAPDIERDLEAGDVAGEEVDVLEHPADHPRREQVQRARDRVREWDRPFGARLARRWCTDRSRSTVSRIPTGIVKRMRVMRFPPAGSSVGGC